MATLGSALPTRAPSSPAPRRAAMLLASVLLGAGTLSACTGDDTDDSGPAAAEALATAADLLASTSGAALELSTSDFPDGATGIVGATGETTDEPAFEGDLDVRLGGTDFTVPVTAFEETVWAQIPLTPGWSDIDPAEYGAPNPALLLGTEQGVGALLTSTEDPERGATVRGGENNSETLTTYSGTIPGAVMERVIPSSAGDSFEIEHRINAEGELVELTMTGIFYEDTEEMTYRLAISEYGLERTITAP